MHHNAIHAACVTKTEVAVDAQRVLKKKNCSATKRLAMKNASQKDLSFLSVFEKGDNLVWRILASGPDAHNAQLTVEGDTPVTPLYVGYVGWPKNGAPESLTEAIFSLELPKEILSFTVGWDEVSVSMNPSFAQTLFSIRDARMINPEIDATYDEWQKWHDLPIEPPKEGPVFSLVVPVFKPKEIHIQELLESVFAQTYKRWELVLVDASPEEKTLAHAVEDLKGRLEKKEFQSCSLKVVTLEKNEGIAPNTNAGIAAATGDYVCFADHDDLLSPNLLAAYARAIKSAEPRNVDLLFCDEDNFEDGLEEEPEEKTTENNCKKNFKKKRISHTFIAPRIKPSFNRGLLLSHNYVVHCLCIRREFLEKLEISSDEMSGAQDYDLTLKALEKGGAVMRVPAVLYHWRAHPGSTNGGKVDQKPYATVAGQRALEQHLARMGEQASVEIGENPATYRVRWEALPKTTPVLYVELNAESLVRTDKDAQVNTQESANENAQEIISTHTTWADELSAAIDKKVESVNLSEDEKEGAFLVVNATGEAAMNARQQRELASALRRVDLGMVAPRLFYPDGLLQYSGTVIASNGSFISINQNFADAMGGGYHGLSELGADYSCLTAPVFALSLKSFKQVENDWRGLARTFKVPVEKTSLSAFAEKLQIAALSLAVRKQGYSVGVSPLVSLTCDGPVKTNFFEKGGLEEEASLPRTFSLAGPCLFSASARAQRKLLKEKKKLLKTFWKAEGACLREDVQDMEGVTFAYGYPQLETWLQPSARKRFALFVRRLQFNLNNFQSSKKR